MGIPTLADPVSMPPELQSLWRRAHRRRKGRAVKTRKRQRRWRSSTWSSGRGGHTSTTHGKRLSRCRSRRWMAWKSWRTISRKKRRSMSGKWVLKYWILWSTSHLPLFSPPPSPFTLSSSHFLLCFVLLFKELGLFNLPTPQKRFCLMQNCWCYVVGFQETDSKSWGHRVLHLSERNDERPL